MTGISNVTNCGPAINGSGEMSPAKPSTQKILEILLPITFAIASSAWPDQADLTLTASSRALVLKTTTANNTQTSRTRKKCEF